MRASERSGEKVFHHHKMSLFGVNYSYVYHVIHGVFVIVPNGFLALFFLFNGDVFIVEN